MGVLTGRDVGFRSFTASALALDAVEVTFGITFTAGVQALFTGQGESSVQVTITLNRRP